MIAISKRIAMKDKILIQRIEEITGQHYDSPKDFDKLSQLIFFKTEEKISPSTLKRVWGYIDSVSSPRSYTLDVLARFLGYRDYDAFKVDYQYADVQSDIAMCGRISCEDLAVGELVELSWLPNRICLVEHLGNGHFRVVEARNTKLSVGDTFCCSLILSHEPMFVDKLMHEGKGPFVYVAGKKDGVTVKRLRRRNF